MDRMGGPEGLIFEHARDSDLVTADGEAAALPREKAAQLCHCIATWHLVHLGAPHKGYMR